MATKEVTLHPHLECILFFRTLDVFTSNEVNQFVSFHKLNEDEMDDPKNVYNKATTQLTKPGKADEADTTGAIANVVNHTDHLMRIVSDDPM